MNPELTRACKLKPLACPQVGRGLDAEGRIPGKVMAVARRASRPQAVRGQPALLRGGPPPGPPSFLLFQRRSPRFALLLNGGEEGNRRVYGGLSQPGTGWSQRGGGCLRTNRATSSGKSVA